MRTKPVRTALALLLASLLASAACSPPSAGSRPQYPGAAAYAQPTGWQPDPAARALYDAVTASAAARRVTLAADPALAAMALEVARRVAADPRARTPSARVLQAFAWHAGIADPLPAVLVLRGPTSELAGELGRSIGGAVDGEGYSHVGIGRATAGLSSVVAVALAQRRVRFEPVPRRVARGARIVVRGALTDGLRTPALTVVHPGGRIEEIPLGEGPDFFGQFPAAARGAYQVELTAMSAVGSTVVANFPVYVDEAPPATPEDTAPAEAEAPAAVEAALLRYANEARAAAGLRPLEALAPLADVARAHSEDMARNRFVAHNSPTAGTPSARLERAGLRSGLALENVGRGYGAREVHEGLMASPGHRANILNPEITHVGVGVAQEPAQGGALFITQDFIAVTAPVEPEAAARALLESVNRARASRGAPPLEPRPQLADAARAAAQAYFADAARSEQDVLGLANARLANQGLLFRRVALTGTVVTRLDDAARLEPLLDRTVRAVGVGVAQGNRPGRPPRSIFVVFVLAVPR